MTKKDKLQHLLITTLLDDGHIELVLPNGLTVELGITKENELGDLEKCDDYCWLIATQQDRSVCIDDYNLGIKYYGPSESILLEETEIKDGKQIKSYSVV